MNSNISLSRAVKIVFISIFVISGIPWMGFGIYQYLWHLRSLDPKYEIVAIMQESHSPEYLKTGFIAELLELSIDHSSNLYQFDLNLAEEKLKAFALIKEASVKRIPPGILFINYSLRKPIAFLGDVANTGIDEEGYIFPFHPFFSPKNLPVIILGLERGDIEWGKKVNHPKLNLALGVLDALDSIGLTRTDSHIRIDAASAEAISLGDQKIIVGISEQKRQHDILLDPLHFNLGLVHYKLLQNKSPVVDSAMIDLRLKELAYIKEKETI